MSLLRPLLLAGAACARLPAAFAPAATGHAPARADARRAAAAPDDFHAPEEQDIIVTGFPRSRDDILVRHLGGQRRRADPRPSPDDRRDAGASARRFGDLVRPQCVAARPARLPGRPRPDPHRRHRQPRRVQHQRRPCGRDQPADRRPDRGAARPGAPCCSARRRSAASSTSSTPASRAACPTRRSMSRASLTYGSAADERSGQCRGRHARRRQFRRPFRRQLHARPTISRPAASSSPPRFAPQAAASPDPAIAALAELRGRSAQQRRADLGHRRRRRLDRRRQQCRLLGQPLRQPLWRPDPLLARPRRSRRRRRASTSPRPASTPAPKSTPATASSIRCGCAAAIPTIAISSSRRRARSRTPFFNEGWRAALEAPPVDPRRLGRRLRRAIFPARLRGRRRGEVPAAPTAPGRSACSRCRRSIAARSRPRRALRYEHSARSAPTPMPISAIPRCAAASTRSPARSAAATRLRRGWRIGLNALAQRARAFGRGIVRQRPACRHPGVRDRRPRPRHREELGPRGDPARHRRRLQLRRLDLPQLVRRLYLRAADRR